jgi:enoyl-[acyl-carrier protein] reductase I
MEYLATPRQLITDAALCRDRAPLRRNVEAAEIEEAAAFLLSDAGKTVTGEVLKVDSGFHVTGM